MQVEDRISIEKAINGFVCTSTNKDEDNKYGYKNEDYVFTTFDEAVEWIKLQK